jgi:hypothetical protein
MTIRSNKFVEKCKQSFALFLCQVWDHLNLPPPTPRQLEMANYLQYGQKRAMIQAFRGVGKSWITSAFVCWLLLRNKNLKILVVSASKDRSDAFSLFTLRLIKEMPMLKHLTPKGECREALDKFDVGGCNIAQAPSVKAAGIFGQITGSRADVIIADDVEVPSNSATDDMREKLMGRVGEFNDILVPEGEPRIIFLGTPQTEESIYNKLRDRGYDCRIWPARYPDAKQIDGYRGALAPTIMKEIKDGACIGDPTDPQRFHEADLIEREASKGRSSFMLQFMLDTSLADSEKYPLKHGDLIVMDLGPEKAPSFIQYSSGPDQQIKDVNNVGFAGDRWYRPMAFDKDNWKRYEGITMAIDPAGRGKDETGFAVVAQLHGKLFVLEVGGLRGGYTEQNLMYLALVAKRNKVRHIVIEANFGDGMWQKIFEPVLNKVYPCTCEEVKHSKQKELRIIDTLEPIMNQHRLVIAREAVNKDISFMMENPEQNQRYSFCYQLTRLCKDRGALKHDDRLDAVAIAVAHYTESMDRDAEKAHKQNLEKLMQAEIDKHLKSIGKLKPKGGFLSRRFGR